MSGKSEKDSKRNMQQEAAGTGGKSSAGAQEKKRAKKQYKKNFTGLLFGEFLTSEVLRKNIGFILLVAFCMQRIFKPARTYRAEQTERRG